MRIVFWLPRPSLHVTPLAEALQDQGAAVTIVADLPPSAERLALGASPREARVETLISPSDETRRGILRSCSGGDGRFHYFSGLGVYEGVTRTMLASTAADGTRAVFLESLRTGDGLGGLRLCRYALRARRLRSQIDCVLAAGVDAVRQGPRIFGPRMPIHEFGYFVDAGAEDKQPLPMLDDRVKLCFVGQLIDRKNVSLLLRALRRVDRQAYVLTVIGTGPQARELGRMATAWKLPVDFRGPVDNSLIRNQLASHDCLILPSKFDGWGAVVNEALHAGTPVIVSDRVGARSLLNGQEMGAVFGTGDAADLRSHLQAVIDRGPVTALDRETLRRAAVTKFGPLAASAYLTRIIANPQERHSAPWALANGALE